MKKTFRKILSFTLAVAMIIGMFSSLSLHVHADWEDGQECWHCGHYHWDQYMCGMCGACSIECTNSTCFVETHCNQCGKCFTEAGAFCTTCRYCEDCYLSEGWHCKNCNNSEECYYIDEGGLCGSCWNCEGCVGEICEHCGFCADCQESEGGMHCEYCNNCFASSPECKEHNNHCEECCLICENCEDCIFEEGLELCEHCGFCPDCCTDMPFDEGCACGEYCVEDSDWFEHVCADCGTPFCVEDKCELCGFCKMCCESYSECSEGMCILDDEYDMHFCEDCGDCFHNNDICGTCEDNGELRCVDCCGIITSDMGCDCSDRCFNEDDFDVHILQNHTSQGGGTHNATPKKDWVMDWTAHWHECMYCTEDAHAKLGYAEHELNKYGVCTICGFDSYARILILKQPRSLVCKVTDYNAGEGEPLNEEDNQVSFSVAAKGLSKLSYQWYVSYGGDWVKLNDRQTEWWESGNTYYTTYGSKMPQLTVSVSPEVCHTTLYYKCVITDEEGNTVESAKAALRSTHIYQGECKPIYGEHIDTIAQYGDNIPVYATYGHSVACIGDGCVEYTEEAHRFSKETRILVNLGTNIYGVPMGDGSEWIEYTCLDCGGKKYEKKHEHYFVDPETGEVDIDYSYENEGEHKLQCLFEHKGIRCTKTTLEKHAFMGWQDMGTPHTNVDGKGIAYKECQVCSYQFTKVLERYDPEQDAMVKTDWTVDNDMVHVRYGYASSNIVLLGDEILVTFAPTDYEKQESIHMTNPYCTGWKVYYVYEKTIGNEVEINITNYISLSKVTGQPTWRGTITSFSGYTGGGIFVFEPIISPTECQHLNGTRISGAYEPVCVKEGYTGNVVCVDCGHIVTYGETIDSYGEHTGTLTLNPLTVREGDCEHFGYTGTSKCSECGMSVRGKTTPKVHSGATNVIGYVAPSCYDFGYSGDTYCECGALISMGTLLAPEHVNVSVVGAKKAGREDGYTGDLVCDDCGITLKYGYRIPKNPPIELIELTVKAPVEGNAISYTLGKGSNDYGLVGTSSTVQDYMVWYVSDDGINYTAMKSGDTFVAGKYYRVSMDVRPIDSMSFAVDASGVRVLPAVKATVNGHNAVVSKVYEQDPNIYVNVTYDFGKCNDTVVELIEIINVTKPIPGQKPNYEVNVSGTGYSIDTSKNAYYDDWMNNRHLYYIRNGVRWSDVTDPDNIKDVYENDVFIAGHDYQVYVYLKTEDGFTFYMNKWYEPLCTATVNGNSAEVYKGGSDALYAQEVGYTFTYEVQDVTQVAVSGITAPRPGATPDYEGIVRNSELYELASYGYDFCGFWWYDSEGVPLEPTDTFVEGETYTLEIKLIPKMDGYVLLSRFGTPMTAVLNGRRIDSSHVMANSNFAYITYDFVCGEPTGMGVMVGGSVTSFNDDTAEVTLQLIEQGMSEPAYEVIVKGNSANYSFDGVAAGTYTLKVSKANHVTREYEVVVADNNVLQDVKIHLKGDINGDGRINVSDVGLANAHAKKVSTLEDYQFECANVNGDTRITISDVGLLNAHAKKTSLLW